VGPIPHGVGYLDSIRELKLHDNLIDGTLPDTLGGLSYLRHFSLDNNALSGTCPHAIGHMPRLKHLSAVNNKLSGSLPESIGSLGDVAEIRLMHNRLQGPLPTSLGDLSLLEHLDISNNHLTGALPSEIGRMSSLRELRLNDNVPGLDSFIPNQLGDAPALNTLLLASNSLRGIVPPFLDGGYHVGRTVDITQNLYYCPLEAWALYTYSITCEHCPDDPPVQNQSDYLVSCSGHGICIDGEYCQCEDAWSGFSTDCSMLACPITEEEDEDGNILEVFCSGNGACVNDRNDSFTCPAGGAAGVAANPSDFLPGGIDEDDFVAYHVDCEENEIVYARCDCIGPRYVAPDCTFFVVQETEDIILSSDGRNSRVVPCPTVAVLSAVTSLSVLLWRRSTI